MTLKTLKLFGHKIRFLNLFLGSFGIFVLINRRISVSRDPQDSRDTTSLQGLLPTTSTSTARFVAYDIHQHEGGEQGDPLMPLLFSLAIHDALQRVKEGLFPGELLFAFLDDVYVVCSPKRVRAVFDLLARELSEHAVIQLNEGKTRVWNRAGV